MFRLIWLWLFFFTLYCYGMTVTARPFSEPMPQCRYLITNAPYDTPGTLPNKGWKNDGKRMLSLGYRFDTDVWLRCSFTNETARPLTRILEMANPHLGLVTLFEKNRRETKGRLTPDERQRLTPSFVLHWQPGETKTVFLKIQSPVSSFIVKPILWTPKAFEKHTAMKHLFLGLFFGAMGALLIYNLFILIFTKDPAYFWYCAYVAGILAHQLFYTGILETYILHEPITRRFFIDFLIALSLVFIPLFTRSFLYTAKTMPRIDKILKLLPFYILLTSLAPHPTLMISLLIPLAPFFVFVAIYGLMLGIRQAKFYAAGWISVAVAMTAMGLVNLGYLPSLSNFPYLPQVGLVFEALIFSIGLADRINTLEREKEEASWQLIQLQRDEQKRLRRMVEERTEDLKQALQEKEMLFKEIHHRVKNNLQMIVSLLRLQSRKTENGKCREILKTANTRIGSLSKLHEMLYRAENLQMIDTREYFASIVKELMATNAPESERVRADYAVTANIDTDRAIYCGLIVNELVTNALKYAFGRKDNGRVEIAFFDEGENFVLVVADNGLGFDQEANRSSMGLTLVDALVRQQLKGSVRYLRERGTRVVITFPRQISSE